MTSDVLLSWFYEENDNVSQIRENRKLLRKKMSAEDFRYDDDEWWHFDYGNQLWAAVLGKPHAIYGEYIDTGSKGAKP